MAEALGLVASIVAVIHLTAKLATGTHQYLEHWRDSPKEMISYQNHLRSLNSTLVCLQSTILSNPEFFEAVGCLKTSIQGCHETLDGISQKLEKARKKTFKRRLEWPFTVGDIDNFQKALDHYKKNIVLALQSDQM